MPSLRSLTLLATAVTALGAAAPAALGALPDDPRYAEQWGLPTIGAPPAWDVTTGGAPGVRVGVIDSGIEEEHPDLAPNIAGNPGEMGGGREDNGVDDDGNGKIDDWRGWDFVNEDNNPQDTTTSSHGTHVAGIIAARGNNALGVAGVAWQAQLVPLRVLGSSGTGASTDAADAVEYAGDLGIRIVNASFGSTTPSAAIRDAMAEAPGTLFVVAAGNGGDDGLGDDNDVTPFYPCAFDLPNVICVAATNASDTLAPFSNRGSTSVDLAAPGVGILSTGEAGGYSALTGTSFAAPFVTGAAALVLARDPSLSTQQLRAAILDHVQQLPALAGKVATGGRLSVSGAVGSPVPPNAPPAAPSGGASAVPVPVPEVKDTRIVRPVASVARSGGRWLVTLRLGERATASVVLQRRAAASRGRPARYVAAGGMRATRLKAGIRRIALGALRPGQYRLRIRVVGARQTTTIVRSFRVPPNRSKEGTTHHVAPGG